MKKKQMYESPRVEMIELQNEATVMTGSVASMPGDTWAPKTSSKSMYRRSNASSSDLEDMIDDILTVEN